MTTHLVKWQQILGISRQGVHDNVKRCNKILSDYEEKLHLVEKFVNIKEKIHRIHGLAKNCESISKEELVSEVEHISQEIFGGVVADGI